MEERMSELLSSELEKSINDIEVGLGDNDDEKLALKWWWWNNDELEKSINNIEVALDDSCDDEKDDDGIMMILMK